MAPFTVAPAAVARLSHPLAIVVAAAGLILAHVLTFGPTDYRRPADAIVVFGARAYDTHTPSEALADRTVTGIRLYQQGLAPVLVFSGGGLEPQAMLSLARRMGVPERAVLVDDQGLNTEATLRNIRGRFGRIIAVSHYYHNARIKLTAERLGISCVTVPAEQDRVLRQEPWYVLRECAAFVKYYLAVGA